VRLLNIHGTCSKYLDRSRIAQQRKKKVLDRQSLMARLACINEGEMETSLEVG